MQVCVCVNTCASMYNTCSLCVCACVNACLSLYNIQSLCIWVYVCPLWCAYIQYTFIVSVYVCPCMCICVIYSHWVYCACVNKCIHVECPHIMCVLCMCEHMYPCIIPARCGVFVCACVYNDRILSLSLWWLPLLHAIHVLLSSGFKLWSPGAPGLLFSPD